MGRRIDLPGTVDLDVQVRVFDAVDIDLAGYVGTAAHVDRRFGAKHVLDVGRIGTL